MRVMFRMFLLASLLLAGFSPLSLQAKKRYHLDPYRVELQLQDDGSLLVKEEIGVVFDRGEFSYVFRDISRRDADSISRVVVHSNDVSITDVSQTRKGKHWRVKWTFPPRQEAATFTLTYTAYGVLDTKNGKNVLSWWAIGQRWNVPIKRAEVSLSLPFSEFSADSLTNLSEGTQLTFLEGKPVLHVKRESIKAKKGLKIRVDFPKRFEITKDRRMDHAILWGLGLSVLGLIAGALGLVKAPRVPSTNFTSTKPLGLSIAHAGFLAHKASHLRQQLFNAMIFDLAQRGYLQIERGKKTFWGQEDIQIQVLHTDEKLSAVERDVIEQLRQYPKLSDFAQKTKAVRFRQQTLKHIEEELISEGLFRSIKPQTKRYLLPAGLALTMGIVLLFLLPLPLNGMVGGGLIGAGIALLIMGSQQSVPTETGVRLQREIKAYLDNIRREIDGFRTSGQVKQAVRQFLQALPWLMLDTKVDSSWLNRLKKAAKQHEDDIELPTWLIDVNSNTDVHSAFSAFQSVIAVANHSSAAGAAGVGAGGGGGGGGGGGAG